MIRKIVIMVLIGGSLALAGCNAVRGAGQDMQSAADCTENVMHQGGC